MLFIPPHQCFTSKLGFSLPWVGQMIDFAEVICLFCKFLFLLKGWHPWDI